MIAVVMRLLCSIILAWLATGASTTRPTALTPAEVTALRASVVAADADRALDAIRKLNASGDPDARTAAAKLLDRDATMIRDDSAAAWGPYGALAKLRAAEAEAAPLRETAIAAAASLIKEPASRKAVRANYDRLQAIQTRLATGYVRPVRIAAALARRAELRAIAGVTANDDDALAQLAEKAWKVAPATVSEWMGPAPGADLTTPADAPLRGLWFHATSRRIEAYNHTLDSALNTAEIAHLKRLNAYREMLGLLPYELDARLTQSARRHSKEMFDLKYFSHWSPTPGHENYFFRDRLAGYPRGSSENITLGGWTGDDAFWFLFDSPGHHRAWLLPSDTAIGIGKWENAWTESFGAGPRMMLADRAERERATIAGEVLEPQKAELTRKKPRDLKEYKFYDSKGRDVTVDAFRAFPKE